MSLPSWNTPAHPIKSEPTTLHVAEFLHTSALTLTHQLAYHNLNPMHNMWRSSCLCQPLRQPTQLVIPTP